MNNIKTAILGGSFDPVHLGHLFLLHTAVEKSGYNRFIIVPAALSNFKQGAHPLTTGQQRLDMLSLALEDYRDLYPLDCNVKIEISDLEVKMGGVSYTYDTVVALKEELCIEGKVGLIIGDDHIENLSKWYRYQDLVKEVEFIICPRNNTTEIWDKIPSDIIYKKLEIAETSPESSTEIRKNPAKVFSYLSDRVKEYVRTNNLYN